MSTQDLFEGPPHPLTQHAAPFTLKTINISLIITECWWSPHLTSIRTWNVKFIFERAPQCSWPKRPAALFGARSSDLRETCTLWRHKTLIITGREPDFELGWASAMTEELCSLVLQHVKGHLNTSQPLTNRPPSARRFYQEALKWRKNLTRK